MDPYRAFTLGVWLAIVAICLIVALGSSPEPKHITPCQSECMAQCSP